MKVQISQALVLAGALGVLAGPVHAQSKISTYEHALTPAGVPNLGGTWSNTTITRWERPEAYGDRAALTPDEVARMEGAAAHSEELANRPTDPNATVETLPNDCSGGRSWCNYNAQWTDTGDHVMRVHGEPRTSLVTFPADGRIPYNAAAQARREEAAKAAAAAAAKATAQGPGSFSNADNPENRSLPERCLVSQNFRDGALLSPTLYNNTYEIVQSPQAVVIVVEMSHDARIVRLNARHGTTPQWFGDSIGWYDGDTLVVETTNFHPAQLRQNSANLKLTERFTRVGEHRLLYRFKVEDPAVYAQPWGGEYEFNTSSGPLYEYACHEGNYGLPNILAGARQQEHAETPAKGQGGGR
jgi:hypothetical protein